MNIGSVIHATGDEFLAIYPVSKPLYSSLTSTLKFHQDLTTFLENCKDIQDVAKETIDKLNELGVTSYEIVQKIQNILEKNKLKPETQEFVDDTFKIEITKINKVEKCGLCDHEEFQSYNYALTNMKILKAIEFCDLNLHAIDYHNNFYFPGGVLNKRSRKFQFSVYDACRVLELI